MARKSLLEILLAGAAIATFAGCEGCTQQDDDDDTGDDDTTTEAPYTEQDVRDSVKCYDSNEDLIDLVAMNEGETVRCVFDGPDEFDGKVEISYAGLSEDSIAINESSLTATMTPDMYDCNLIAIADGSLVDLKDGEKLSLTIHVTEDSVVDDMELVEEYDAHVVNDAPDMADEAIHTGVHEVGEPIEPFYINDETDVTDEQDSLSAVVIMKIIPLHTKLLVVKCLVYQLIQMVM